MSRNKKLLLETLVDVQTAIEQFQDALDTLHNVLGANPLLNRHVDLLNVLKQADAAAENLFDETATILEEE